MRIFLPCTLPALAQVLADGEVRGPLHAYAAVPGPGGTADDTEELEYAALRAAAEESLRLLGADPGAPRRRVVIAADVPDHLVEAGGGTPARVAVSGTVPLKRVASAHIDAPDAAADIAAALEEPGAGHEDGHELLWYAAQELRYQV